MTNRSFLVRDLLPEHRNAIMNARTPRGMSNAITKHETAMAQHLIRDDFLWCDHAAEIMSDALRIKRIDHDGVVGETRHGDSHVWIRVNGVNLDPTKQGCYRGRVVSRHRYKKKRDTTWETTRTQQRSPRT